MMRRRRWLWVLLFIWAALLLGILATSWNVVLVQDYRQTLTLAKQVKKPWTSLVTGTLGFAAAIATILLFFLKILKEMKLNQVQSEFLATVSHELKTPIASIELSSSLIRAGGLSEDEVSSLWKSHSAELKRLREEVETLLEAARMETHPQELNRTPVQLESWVSQSFERWRRILGPGSRLVREGEPLSVNARLDLKTLNLITDNLVENARKFSRGDPELVVRTSRTPARAFWKKSGWQIEFRDQGWGFDPSDSEKIFRRFFRARTEAPYSIPGNGLGLYFADSASRALGIKLHGESAGRGQGASFMLEGKESTS